MRNINYDHVDWRQRNRTIALELGVSDEAVRLARKRLNARQFDPSSKTPAQLNRLNENKEKASSLKSKVLNLIKEGCSIEDVSRKLWVSVRYIKQLIGIKFNSQKYDFSEVDWDKPAREIAREVGCSLQLVYKRRPHVRRIHRKHVA